jgi:uncharacterized protein (TIGR01370 family)
VLALAAALAVAAPAQAIEIDRMAGVRSFALALGDGAAARADGFDLVVVDGSTPARRVKQLRAGGALVFGYLSVGTIESYRSWFKAAKPYRMELWDDWGEWYARVSAPGFRRLIVKRVAPAILERGFDGLFLDNVDMIETHPAQAAGMRKLVRALWRGPGVLMAQNGDSIIEPFLRYLDAWNREDVTSTYDFDAERYRRVPAADHADALATLGRLSKRLKLVTATDYVAAGDTAGAAAAREAACGAGALSFVSDIELRRIPPPAECP